MKVCQENYERIATFLRIKFGIDYIKESRSPLPLLKPYDLLILML